MTHNLALKLEERYTYKDYMTWNDNNYWELIDGIAIRWLLLLPDIRWYQFELSRQFGEITFWISPVRFCRSFRSQITIRR